MALTRRHLLAFFSAAALGGSAATLGGCKIVANADLKAAKAKSSDEFDANAYVDKIWTSKVLAGFRSQAMDVDALLQQVAQDPDKAGQAHGHRAGDGNPWTFEIKGEGKITAVDFGLAPRHRDGRGADRIRSAQD